MPDIKAQLAGLGFDAFSTTPQQLEGFVNSEIKNWHSTANDAGPR